MASKVRVNLLAAVYKIVFSFSIKRNSPLPHLFVFNWNRTIVCVKPNKVYIIQFIYTTAGYLWTSVLLFIIFWRMFVWKINHLRKTENLQAAPRLQELSSHQFSAGTVEVTPWTEWILFFCIYIGDYFFVVAYCTSCTLLCFEHLL